MRSFSNEFGEMKAGKLLVALMFLTAAVAIVYFLFLSPSSGVDKNAMPTPAPPTTPTMPEGPLTSVELFDGKLYFADQNSIVHALPLFFVVRVSQPDFPFDMQQYSLRLDKEAKELVILDICPYEDPKDWNKCVDLFWIEKARYRYKPGELTGRMVALVGRGGKEFYYNFMVSKDERFVFFFLRSQGFNLQFGKHFSFEGTDVTGDKKVDAPYYQANLDIENYPFYSGRSKVAIFSFKETGTAVSALLYVDTSRGAPLTFPAEEASAYDTTVEFVAGPGLKIQRSDDRKRIMNAYGTLIEASPDFFAIRMPKK
jgi:hypothetical protein